MFVGSFTIFTASSGQCFARVRQTAQMFSETYMGVKGVDEAEGEGGAKATGGAKVSKVRM